MEKLNRKKHWETIYVTKALNEVSWYQPTPQTSLNFIKELQIPTTAKIIDVGGGDSFLVDHLLELGYQDITVLDISAASLERAKQRLGNKATKVKWIVADAAQFQPTEQYDFWHDRAAFHFLTEPKEINNYIAAAQQGLKDNGILVIGTFSEEGPKKCSGIDIKQYSETTMSNQFKNNFEKINCITVNHPTPFDTLQHFVFCSFRKKDNL
ncbi:MAG: class I SAM-dependent methyltransferase [Vicingus serpentipes]|nr:class I SAM-dependent methyltransferase [Vicingus serpentipes]